VKTAYVPIERDRAANNSITEDYDVLGRVAAGLAVGGGLDIIIGIGYGFAQRAFPIGSIHSDDGAGALSGDRGTTAVALRLGRESWAKKKDQR
jgi:hypothetical protein